MAPALAAGNAVVIKPSMEAPLSIIRVVELLHEAGVPGSTMQVVTGRGSVVGEILASSPKVQIVSMTGDTQTGIRVAQNAAKNLARTFLELGGNDALVVFDDAISIWRRSMPHSAGLGPTANAAARTNVWSCRRTWPMNSRTS